MSNGLGRAFLFTTAIIGLASSCARKAAETSPVVLADYPITTLDVLTRDSTAVDNAVTSDGNGSLRIHAGAPMTVRLYETGDLDVEDARVIYQAKVRSDGLEGKAYLEMWCSFAGKGEFFSRALQAPISGTTEWASQEAPFFLKKGDNPDNVKLNLVIDGKGTVWIDDIKLMKGPLGTS